MDVKLFNGTTKYQKFLLSPKITYLDYVKLHGVQGNPSGTVAGPFAISYHIIIRLLINVQVQGHHPHQWAPFQVTG